MNPNMVADTAGIASGEEAGAGRAANGCRGIVVGEAGSLRRHGIDVGSFYFAGSIAPEIVIPLVIDEDENDVWFVLLRVALGDEEEE